MFCLLAAGACLAGESVSPQEMLQKAMEMQRAGDAEGAIGQYRAFLKEHPDVPFVHSNLGAALAQLGRYSEAISEYEEALKESPDSPDRPAISLNLALAYYKMGQYGPAAEKLTTVHKALPDNQQATLLLSDCYLRLGKNGKVIELLEPLAQKQPDSTVLAYMLGTALIRDQRPAEGQMYVERILKNGDSAEARLLMGMTKMAALDFAGARADLERAVQLNPKLPDVYSYYGSALMNTGDTPKAAEAFHKELASNPNDFNANLYLGVLAKQDQDYPAALSYFERALQLRPGDIAVRYQIATIHAADGHQEKARQELEAIVKEAPQFTEAHVTLATVYYKLKRKEDGDRERAIVQKLNAAAQAKQPGVKVVNPDAAKRTPQP